MQSYCERKGRRDPENTETNIDTNVTGETRQSRGKLGRETEKMEERWRPRAATYTVHGHVTFSQVRHRLSESSKERSRVSS